MPNYLSDEGLEKLKQELQDLKDRGRKEIAERLEAAKALGDLSENSEYQEAREAQELLEQKILEMEERLRNAVVIQKDQRTDEVRVGSTVLAASNAGEETYTIVGSEEAKPSENKISNESPIGKAFLGRKVGDAIEVKTPMGVITYKILQIM